MHREVLYELPEWEVQVVALSLSATDRRARVGIAIGRWGSVSEWLSSPQLAVTDASRRGARPSTTGSSPPRGGSSGPAWTEQVDSLVAIATRIAALAAGGWIVDGQSSRSRLAVRHPLTYDDVLGWPRMRAPRSLRRQQRLLAALDALPDAPGTGQTEHADDDWGRWLAARHLDARVVATHARTVVVEHDDVLGVLARQYRADGPIASMWSQRCDHDASRSQVHALARSIDALYERGWSVNRSNIAPNGAEVRPPRDDTGYGSTVRWRHVGLVDDGPLRRRLGRRRQERLDARLLTTPPLLDEIEPAGASSEACEAHPAPTPLEHVMAATRERLADEAADAVERIAVAATVGRPSADASALANRLRCDGAR